jgi:hypothetical protein
VLGTLLAVCLAALGHQFSPFVAFQFAGSPPGLQVQQLDGPHFTLL